MEKYCNNIQDTFGNAISGVTVTVRTNPGGVLATLFSDDGVSGKSNPFSNESDGEFFFYAANDRYDIFFTVAITEEKTDLILFDPADAVGGSITDGNATGDFTIWDGAAWEPNSNISWDDTLRELVFKSTAGGAVAGSLRAINADDIGFFDAGGTRTFYITEGDGGNVVVEKPTLRMESKGASNGSAILAFFSSGSSRALIYVPHANYLFFDQESSGIEHALFGYPLAVESAKYPSASPAVDGSTLYASVDSNPFAMNKQEVAFPICDPMGGLWRFNNPTSAADPGGPGFMRVNNADFASATELYFDEFDAGATFGPAANKDDWFTMLAVGDLLLLTQVGDPSRFLHCTVDVITDNTGWHTIDITPNAHGGTVFINARDVQVQIERRSIA